MMERNELMEHLENNSRVFKTKAIKEAFEAIDRADFVDGDYTPEAYEDYMLPIGHEQTITKPTTAAFMLELLDPQKGERVLEVGSGSGWITALLAHMVGEKGHVYATEHIPELVAKGQKNIKKYKLPQAEISQAGKKVGLKQDFMYDKILVDASVEDVPSGLIDQLKIGGTMVIPVDDALFKIHKKSKNETERKEYPGFMFSPLV